MAGPSLKTYNRYGWSPMDPESRASVLTYGQTSGTETGVVYDDRRSGGEGGTERTCPQVEYRGVPVVGDLED